MRILISVDIEGVTGICSWDETELGTNTYSYFQKIMTQEASACAQTLIDLGVEEVYIRDAHDSARNLIPDLLPEQAKLIRNWSNAPCDMMDGINLNMDGVIFIGYHSPARSEGNPLSHTLTTSLNHIKINNQVVSEFLINAYYAQTLGVPVIMVTGDENLTNLVKKENPLIETVTTNIGMHGAIITKHPNIVLSEIKIATAKALKTLKHSKNSLNIPLPSEFEVEIHFRNHQKAYRASFYPGAYKIKDDKTGFKSHSFDDVLRFIMFTS